jgi:cytochrome c
MWTYFRALLLISLWIANVGAAAPDPVPDRKVPDQKVPDYRFKVEVLAEGMPQPMELELAPDGRIFFNEIAGKLKIWKPNGEVVVAGELKVFTPQENGFLGFALDPGFKTNNWIYLYYSPKEHVGQRLSRFVVRADTLDLASEIKVLEFGEQRRDCCHHAGSVEFGPDSNLYISTGDNTSPGGDSAGYAPIDERPGREPEDAQKSSSNTHDLRGKILRIRPTSEGGYTIPDGNLFPKDGSQGRPEIFVMGCRNPWRMSIDERTGFVYWGEVGPDAGGDGPRGPRGYDEINQARHAGNFGWPYFVGSNFAYAHFDHATQTLGPKYDPLRPVNNSPNNTGAKMLPPAQPAFIYWPYGASKEFPMLGGGGRTACAGPVFHFKPEFRNTGGFPDVFDNCLLFYDWQRPFIKWARLDSDSHLVDIEPFTSAVSLINEPDAANVARSRGEFVIQRPVDSQFGPDGCLYLLDYGETWGANKDSKLLKISYQWGNIAPIAKASADKTAGREPLTIAFSSAGSKDWEGDPLTYQWRMHPGAKAFSSEPNPILTVDKPGNYIAELRVSDNKGAVATASIPLIVGNSVPEVRFTEPRDGDFFTPGRSLRYAVEVKDAEDGSSRDYEEVFEPRTYVNATFGRGDGRREEAAPGLASMKQSDCFNCHAIEQKIVGPPLVEIAQRYRGQNEALEASVQRVIKGSSGVWSDVPMLPHELLNPDQVRMMVRWVFALEPGKTGANMARGLTGELKVPKDEKLRVATLEATYTDNGRASVAPLSGKATVKLRSRRLEAELADEKHGAKVLGKFLGAIDHGHYAKFADINLSDSASVTFRVASAGSGGKIELHCGSATGPLLAEVEVSPTGGWDKWTDLTAPFQPVTNRTDIYILFTNPGKGGLMNLDWLQFNPK